MHIHVSMCIYIQTNINIDIPVYCGYRESIYYSLVCFCFFGLHKIKFISFDFLW